MENIRRYAKLSCLLPVFLGLASCSAFDNSPSGTDVGDAGGPDSTLGDGAAEVDSNVPYVPAGCVQNLGTDASCAWICPEVCDGIDNDCDGKTDEIEESCDLANAFSKCDENQCAIARCVAPYRDCDKETSNGCETALNTLYSCGVCNVFCTGLSCAGGACSELDCPSGNADCDMDSNNGCETAITTLTDCLMCGQRCSSPNAISTCTGGKCEFRKCRAGYADCDGDEGNGCETALNTLENCGTCGVLCEASNGEPSCPGGRCTTSKCDEGFADCNGDPADGCETSLHTLDRCGRCDDSAKCGPLDHATATCSSGTCQVAECEGGYGDCDGEPSNGCETALTTNQNCGECRKACGYSDAVSSCETGSCQITGCNAGFGDCNSIQSDGCEARLDTASTCGSCANDCGRLPNVYQVSCDSGSCSVRGCLSGYADCNSEPGCETPLGTTTDCSACGNRCPALPDANYPYARESICSSNACMISQCEVNHADCNGSLADGCEVDLFNDVDNCNRCGASCGPYDNATAKCTGGACALASCSSNYDDCDGVVTNGCEADLSTTTDHCGLCFTACTNDHGTTSCSAAVCVPSCTDGYADCDGLKSNGCETDLNTVSDCGSCGRTCTSSDGTPVCNAGTCGTVCALTGTYAIKVTTKVNWEASQYLRAGSNQTFYAWSKLQVTQSGNTLTGTLTACGKDLAPVYSSSLFFSGESYKLLHPNSVYDSANAPSASVTVTLGSSSPGASLTLPSTALLLGVSMSNPINGSWPSKAADFTYTKVDMDSDGKPGVTASYSTASPYVYPPAEETLGPARADAAYIADRLVFSLSGTLTNCTQSSGTAEVTHQDMRTLGCNLSGSSNDCGSSEATFLDDNQIDYQPISATYTLLKLSDAATCATVRSTLP